MSPSRWAEFAAEQAVTSWRAWLLGLAVTFVAFAALLALLESLGGPPLWGLLPSALGPLLALVLLRVVARRSR